MKNIVDLVCRIRVIDLELKTDVDGFATIGVAYLAYRVVVLSYKVRFGYQSSITLFKKEEAFGNFSW